MLATLSFRLAALRPIVYSGLAEKSSLSIGISGLDARFQFMMYIPGPPELAGPGVE